MMYSVEVAARTVVMSDVLQRTCRCDVRRKENESQAVHDAEHKEV